MFGNVENGLYKEYKDEKLTQKCDQGQPNLI